MHARVWLGALATLVVACAGRSVGSSPGGAGAAGAGATVPSECDPLAPVTRSIELEAGHVIAAGRAKDGTLYFVYDDHRLFVGSDENLVERYVIGSSETLSQLDLLYTDDDGVQVTVEVTRDATGTHMAVARGMQMSKRIDSGNAEPLTLLDAAATTGQHASSTETFEIDFAASLPDRRELVVVAPQHPSNYDSFRVFFGQGIVLRETDVTEFFSSNSGQRTATLVIDGAPADLSYLVGPDALNPSGGPATLTLAGTTYPLTEGPLPSDTQYHCLPD